MPEAQQVELPSKLPDELAEIESQIQFCKTEAALLARSMEAIAVALRVNASRIRFKGDLIVRSRSAASALEILNMARVRNVVSNLKALQTQRKQLKRAGLGGDVI